MDEQEKQKIRELLKNADLDKCDGNQLITIINLFDLLEIPMKEPMEPFQK